MGSTVIAFDRFRRRGDRAAAAVAPGPDVHPLVGALLATSERRYGLMTSDEPVLVTEVIATSGDLAVADRLAFLAAIDSHASIVVVAFDGWYAACALQAPLSTADFAAIRLVEGAPRIMSLVTDRGITPALGPLVA